MAQKVLTKLATRVKCRNPETNSRRSRDVDHPKSIDKSNLESCRTGLLSQPCVKVSVGELML
jgi:hypothetical protein